MPPKLTANATKPRKKPTFWPSSFVTPQRYRTTERKVFRAADYDDVHRSVGVSLHAYTAWPRKNSVRVCGGWFDNLRPSKAYLLGAANVEARICFAKTAVHEVIGHLEDFEGPVCFFSVCPHQYVMPMRDAHFVDLHGLKKLTGQVFAGCSLVGSIDFALYKGFGRHGVRAWHNQVGAHTHGLVWGKSAEELRANLQGMGPDFINVKGECAGYVQQIGADEIAGYMRYALKLPLFEYNVTAADDNFDPDTGEVFRTKKVSANPLRPGDQLRMSALLHDMSLDHLIFGQHEGTAVVREVRRRARLPLMRRNEIAQRHGSPPSSRLALEEIWRWKRMPVSKLIRTPPKKVWLGPKPSTLRVDAFLGSQEGLAALQGQTWDLPELVMN